MADKKIPRGSSSPNSPGLGGAIKDAIGAIAGATAPRSVTQRAGKLRRDIAAAEGDYDESYHGRMREGQSTDSNNR